MSYQIKWRAEVCWIPDGAGQMEVPSGATKIINTDFGGSPGAGGPVVVPGGDSPTGANFTTAANSVGTALGLALNNAATLAQIQGFSTGGG